MIKNVHKSSCNVPRIFDRDEWDMNFVDRDSKNTQVSNFMKICPEGTKVFYEDGNTDLNLLVVCVNLWRHLKWKNCKNYKVALKVEGNT